MSGYRREKNLLCIYLCKYTHIHMHGVYEQFPRLSYINTYNKVSGYRREKNLLCTYLCKYIHMHMHGAYERFLRLSVPRTGQRLASILILLFLPDQVRVQGPIVMVCIGNGILHTFCIFGIRTIWPTMSMAAMIVAN